MLSHLTLLLLLGFSVCTAVGDSGEELALSTEAEPWVTVNLEGIPMASIELRLQERKRSKTRQFFGLMGKRVEGYQLGQLIQSLLGKKGLSIEGTCRQETPHWSTGPEAVAREGLHGQEEDQTHLPTSHMQ
uniref:Tachykinin 4 n=1 Tax=Nannospalax galili TaxID=1026970 RepID=A0A8C6REK2_NANGA